MRRISNPEIHYLYTLQNTKSTKVVYMPSKYYTKLTVNTIFGGKYALDVEPGDHVYSYVNVLGLRVYIYSHHGKLSSSPAK